MIAIIAFVIVAGFCKFVADSIAHYDRFKKLGYWFSRDAMANAKYEFIKNHPSWATGVKKWIVANIFVMFLDAWHLSAMVTNLNAGFIVAYFMNDPMYVAYVFFGISSVFLLLYNSKRK